MADFLLQEDGTSLIELEDGTGFLLLESPPPPPPPPYATWKVGVINVPSSTGNLSVTGLGGTPAAVFFWGTNWLTEDTAVTADKYGVFRGMAAPNFSSPGTTEQNVMFQAPAGEFFEIINGYCIISMPSPTGAGDVFRAYFVSFDGDGFTVNFDVGNAGGYKVMYAALMDISNIGAYVGTNGTPALGFKAGAALEHGALFGPHAGHLYYTAGQWGGGAYPSSSSINWMGAGLSALTFPTSASGQYVIGIFDDAPDVVVAQGGAFIGPFLASGDVTMFPSGGSLTDFTTNFTNSNGGMMVAWDDEDSATGRLTPAQNQGDTTTVSGLSFAPGLVIGYTISDEPQGQGTGSRGALGMSLAHSDGTQWAATVDGYSTGYGAFQSFQRGFVDTVDGTDVHAGTIELTADGFILTTEEDSATTHDWVWHAFGHPDRITAWLPHIYRRVFG